MDAFIKGLIEEAMFGIPQRCRFIGGPLDGTVREVSGHTFFEVSITTPLTIADFIKNDGKLPPLEPLLPRRFVYGIVRFVEKGDHGELILRVRAFPRSMLTKCGYLPHPSTN